MDALPQLVEGRYHPLLGTDVRIQVWADERRAAVAAEDAAGAEMVRLQQVFSIYDPTSQLSRWRRGQLVADHHTPELTAALTTAHEWFVAGGGTFHPGCRALQDRWRRAAKEGAVPSHDEMQALADAGRALGFRVEDGAVVVDGDCSGVDLNAFAKGWIVDAAVARAASMPGVVRVGVNAGGDLRHHGRDSWRVGVENPLNPSDNGADRLCTLQISNQAVATSGLARRGFTVEGQWFGHVVDPRNGWPVQHVAQVSVVAPTAADADALATICGVLPVDESLAFVAGHDGCEVLLVEADGRVTTSSTSVFPVG